MTLISLDMINSYSKIENANEKFENYPLRRNFETSSFSGDFSFFKGFFSFFRVFAAENCGAAAMIMRT